jgi:hypothetical protein
MEAYLIGNTGFYCSLDRQAQEAERLKESPLSCNLRSMDHGQQSRRLVTLRIEKSQAQEAEIILTPNTHEWKTAEITLSPAFYEGFSKTRRIESTNVKFGITIDEE